VDYEEDSENPEAERSKDGSDDSSKKPALGSVGFVVDGIDLRDVEAEDILIADGDDDPLDFSPPEDFALPPQALPPQIRPPSVSPPSKQKSSTTPSPLPQLWPTDLDALMKGEKPKDDRLNEFFKKNVVRPKSFRLTGNGMLYYPQISFGHGVKYGGTMALSQTIMLLLAASKTEALRLGQQEIGCEHILLAVLQNQGFAAGQLLLSLHLNAIGKPYSLGDVVGTARRIIEGPNTVTFDKMSAITRGVKSDMYFTAEADEMLVQAMYAAAKNGQPAVASKHLLCALVQSDNEDVQAALGALFVTRKEIEDALAVCPDTDDLTECARVILCSILYCFIRFRLFQAPIRKYASYVSKKDAALLTKNSGDDFKVKTKKKRI